jgi:GNAT superfamily N-acetyltransferase
MRMGIKLQPANDRDAAAIAALRMGVARQLTAEFGRGTWSFAAESEWGVRADIMTSQVMVAKQGGTVAATLRLSTRKPWLCETDFFTPCRSPLYLTSMAVSPKLQRTGIGRGCLREVRRIAAEWPADAIRLDAYDAPAGAGDFYLKCGYREVARVPYNGTPLIFFELLISEAERKAVRDMLASDSQEVG